MHDENAHVVALAAAAREMADRDSAPCRRAAVALKVLRDGRLVEWTRDPSATSTSRSPLRSTPRDR